MLVIVLIISILFSIRMFMDNPSIISGFTLFLVVFPSIAILVSLLLNYLDFKNGNNLLKNDINQTTISIVNENNILGESLVKILEKENGKYLELLNSIEVYKFRLNNQVESLVKNRNLNLIIGLLITGLSIYLLIQFFILEHSPKTEDLVFYYASRFTAVISIEIFSLFFLKLYSANLAEVKYFQNELSNVESKIIALKTAMLVEQPELIAEVVKELVKTERNYILKKDETTVDLERTKLDKEDNKHLLDSLLQTIKDIKSK